MLPKVLYGLELVSSWNGASEKKADATLGDLLQEALLVGPISNWWASSQPRVRKGALFIETGVPHMAALVEQRKLGLVTAVASAHGSMAGRMCATKLGGTMSITPDPWLEKAAALSAAIIGTRKATLGVSGHKAARHAKPPSSSAWPSDTQLTV